MPIDEQGVINAVLRSTFRLFVERCFLTLNPGRTFLSNWHHRAIDHQLALIHNGDSTRLIINLQPRSLKSLIVSVAYPAFVLGHDPSKRIYVISYGSDLADKHSSDFRSIVESNWYKRAFPRMRIRKSLEVEVTTTDSGYRRSTTVMGALTGLGGDIFILDDPQKVVDAQSEARRNSLNQWFANTLISRLDNKTSGAIIIVMQRVHMNDLCGFLTETSDDWTVLSLPAIAEIDERIPIGMDKFHLRHAGEALVRDRFDYPRLKETAIAQAQRHRPSMILIEDASTGTALAQELKKAVRMAVKLVRPEHDKIGRMFVQQDKFYARRVHFPKGAPFLAELERELLQFPNGKTDDQVDSISQALNNQLSNYAENLIAAMR